MIRSPLPESFVSIFRILYFNYESIFLKDLVSAGEKVIKCPFCNRQNSSDLANDASSNRRFNSDSTPFEREKITSTKLLRHICCFNMHYKNNKQFHS